MPWRPLVRTPIDVQARALARRRPADSMVQGWDTVGETALVNGHQIRVRRKDLEAEDGCQDPNFFDDDYSIAASTGIE